ncbi:MAG: hypothetical protein ACOCS6_02575, partial [Desulfosalsimonas sp.]
SLKFRSETRFSAPPPGQRKGVVFIFLNLEPWPLDLEPNLERSSLEVQYLRYTQFLKNFT